MKKTTTASGMKNSQWLALQTTKDTNKVIKIFSMLNLKQKGLSSFWEAFNQVRDYIN